jgi:two-component system cell cycle response regulator CtrA
MSALGQNRTSRSERFSTTELKIIDVFICKLRKKLANASEGRNFIETVWGRGYVLREPHEVEERIPA